MNITEAAGFKGLFVMRFSFGEPEHGSLQYGEPLLHFGEMHLRHNDKYDDEYVCFRIGDKSDERHLVSPDDGYFFQAFPEIDPGTTEWIAWVQWCVDKAHYWESNQGEYFAQFELSPSFC